MLITAYGTVETAVEAFQRGAHDYILKPVLFDELIEKLRKLFATRQMALENQWLRRELQPGRVPNRNRWRWPGNARVFRLVDRVAPTDQPFSSPGKAARARSDRPTNPPGGPRSRRRGQPPSPFEGFPQTPARMIAVNCAGDSKDLLENQLFGHRKGAFTGADRDQPGVFLHAGAGTVFLDEVARTQSGPSSQTLARHRTKRGVPGRRQRTGQVRSPASSPPPTRTWPKWWKPASFVRTFITVLGCL